MGIDRELKIGQQEKSENATPKSLFEWAFGFSPGNVNLDPISLQEGEIIGKNPRYGTVERDSPILSKLLEQVKQVMRAYYKKNAEGKTVEDRSVMRPTQILDLHDYLHSALGKEGKDEFLEEI